MQTTTMSVWHPQHSEPNKSTFNVPHFLHGKFMGCDDDEIILLAGSGSFHLIFAARRTRRARCHARNDWCCLNYVLNEMCWMLTRNVFILNVEWTGPLTHIGFLANRQSHQHGGCRLADARMPMHVQTMNDSQTVWGHHETMNRRSGRFDKIPFSVLFAIYFFHFALRFLLINATAARFCWSRGCGCGCV